MGLLLLPSGLGRHHRDEGRAGLHGGALLDVHLGNGPGGAGLQLVLHPLGIACNDTRDRL